jgi:hypothetical protein
VARQAGVVHRITSELGSVATHKHRRTHPAQQQPGAHAAPQQVGDPGAPQQGRCNEITSPLENSHSPPDAAHGTPKADRRAVREYIRGHSSGRCRYARSETSSFTHAHSLARRSFHCLSACMHVLQMHSHTSLHSRTHPHASGKSAAYAVVSCLALIVITPLLAQLGSSASTAPWRRTWKQEKRDLAAHLALGRQRLRFSTTRNGCSTNWNALLLRAAYWSPFISAASKIACCVDDAGRYSAS